MKTVCFFNSTEAWGGGEKWHLEACAHLHASGHPVLAIAHKNGELFKRLRDTGIDTLGISIGNLSFLNPLKIRSMVKILRKKEVGTIVMNLSRDLKFGGLASKRAGLDRIIYRRGSAIAIKNSGLNRYYFGNIVTEVLANSRATKETVLERNPKLFPRDKIKVIYNGIDIDGFLGKSAHPIYQKTDADEIVLANLGRLERQKNQKFLIKLAAELQRRKLKFKIIIGGEGRLLDALQNAAASLKVEQHLLFAGFIENPKDLICNGDVFVLSSLWEGFGYVLAEASLCKKPIIAFDCSSNPEIVRDGHTGYLVPVNDIDAFADKIQFLAEHPETRKEMGAAGCEYVRDNFNSEQIQEKILNFLVHGR